MEDSFRASLRAKEYLLAQLKERELENLKGFYRDKKEEISRFEAERLETAAARRMQAKYTNLEENWEQKFKIFERHAQALEDELVLRQEEEVRAKIHELEQILPREPRGSQEVAGYRRNEAIAVKKKE